MTVRERILGIQQFNTQHHASHIVPWKSQKDMVVQAYMISQ